MKDQIALLKTAAIRLVESMSDSVDLPKRADSLVRVIEAIERLNDREAADTESKAIFNYIDKILALEDKYPELIEIKFKGPYDLTHEAWRDYIISGNKYRIHNPQQLWISETLHRISDDTGQVHCIPFPNGGQTLCLGNPNLEVL